MVEVSTPSPPRRVHTPQTPKHGYSDPWEPYSPRKSARISQRASNNRTPSPRSTTAHTPRKATEKFNTPTSSPKKKRSPIMDSVRRASGSLTADSTASAAALLGIGPKPQAKIQNSASAACRNEMLPTPAKTPRKNPDEKTAAAARAVARNLFSGDSDSSIASSTKQRKPKKYSGLTLDSFTAVEAAGSSIQIFTDSRDRVPELDTSKDNPFYGESSTAVPVPVPDPSKRRSTKRNTVFIPGEGRVDVGEAAKRDDGTVYVFRGKKIWKSSFAVNPADQLQADGAAVTADDDVDETTGSRRVTRSSAKPRLLFPPKKKKGKGVADYNIEDEEATTDIEDHVTVDAVDAEENSLGTPTDIKTPGTPAAPRFAPASPPTTARATRVTKQLDNTPIKHSGKAPSPFNKWRTTKSSKGHGQKREAEPSPNEGASKRQRA